MSKTTNAFLVALSLSVIIILGQSQTIPSTVPATTTTGSPALTTTATTNASEMPLYEADSISQITNNLGGRWDMWAGQEWHFNLDLQQKDNIITGTMNCLSRYELETYVNGQVSSNGTVEFIRRGPPGYNWTQYYVGKLTATPDHILMNGNYNSGGHLEPVNSKWYATAELETTVLTTYRGDVDIEDLGPNSDIKLEIIATDSTGRSYCNAKVYIDNQFVGRTSSEDVFPETDGMIPKGTYWSNSKLTSGTHAIVVEYDPNPPGDSPIGSLPDLGAWLKTMGCMVPGSKSIYAYAGYVPASGEPQKFTVRLNTIRQDIDPRNYDLNDWVDWFNFFAQFVPTPGIG